MKPDLACERNLSSDSPLRCLPTAIKRCSEDKVSLYFQLRCVNLCEILKTKIRSSISKSGPNFLLPYIPCSLNAVRVWSELLLRTTAPQTGRVGLLIREGLEENTSQAADPVLELNITKKQITRQNTRLPLFLFLFLFFRRKRFLICFGGHDFRTKRSTGESNN